MLRKGNVLLETQKSLSIGTANFNQSYGQVESASGLKEETLIGIFNKLQDFPNIGLDTSPEYGNSEESIGTFPNFKGPITTKIPNHVYSNSNKIIESVMKSLHKLNRTTFQDVLFHGVTSEFVSNSAIISRAVDQIIENGLSKSVGLSCYSEEEVVLAKSLVPRLSVFQVPENIVDQRLRNSDQISGIQKEGNDFYIRSIFLQGYLLKGASKLPQKVIDLRPSIESINAKAGNLELSNLEYCLAYAKSIKWAKGVIVGVESVTQLELIINAFLKTYDIHDFDAHIADRQLVDPRNWQK